MLDIIYIGWIINILFYFSFCINIFLHIRIYGIIDVKKYLSNKLDKEEKDDESEDDDDFIYFLLEVLQVGLPFYSGFLDFVFIQATLVTEGSLEDKFDEAFERIDKYALF